MSLKNNTTYKFILFAVGVIVVLLAALLFVRPAAIFPDPSWGFLVLRSMQMGSAFNTLVTPDHDNIANNVSQFITWWSPAQYLIPHFFATFFNLNTGHATAVTIALCQVIGLAGFYLFFKKVAFSPLICALSVVLIICQQAFFSAYIFYNGGQTLLFAFSGWFLLGCLIFNKPGLKLVLFVLLSGLIGFICKSSFLWMYAAGLLFIWVQLGKGGQNIGQWLVKALWPGIPALVAVAAIHFLYLSKGDNPSSSYIGGFKLSWAALSFPIGSPLIAGFSVDDLFNGLILNNNTPMLSHTAALLVVVLCAILSLVLMYSVFKYVPNNDYKLLLLIFYAVSVVFFGYAYISQMNISYEARHFRIIGLLIIPGTLYFFSQVKPVYRTVPALAVLVIAFFSISFYTKAYAGLKTKCAYGPSGIAQQFIDQPSLNYINMLDKQHKNALFVFTSPDLGLEVKHNRIIILPPLNDDISIDFDDEYLHKGYGGGPIYILLPAKYMGIRASVILKCFPGYKGFSLKQVSDNYVLYFATQAR